ncbi:hypothetical protein MC885_002268 [Smutsia gigantea]|nr:hypothetical protein MC885_002268 [Smutsia gigantea]
MDVRVQLPHGAERCRQAATEPHPVSADPPVLRGRPATLQGEEPPAKLLSALPGPGLLPALRPAPHGSSGRL